MFVLRDRGKGKPKPEKERRLMKGTRTAIALDALHNAPGRPRPGLPSLAFLKKPEPPPLKEFVARKGIPRLLLKKRAGP
jgi:hypothetical protein